MEWIAAAYQALPWEVWAIMALLVMAGAIMQAGAGIGFGSGAAPGAMLFAPMLMPATILCLSFIAASLGAARLVGRIAYGQVAIALIGRSIGSALAAWLIVTLGSRDSFALLFAGLMLLGVGLSLWRIVMPLNWLTLIAAGTLSGLMVTITTIGGAPMVLIYQNEPPEVVKPTLNAYFAIGTIPPLIALWSAGVLTTASLGYAAVLLPAVLVGVALTRFFVGIIDRRYKTILLSFCVLTAVVIAVRALVRMAG